MRLFVSHLYPYRVGSLFVVVQKEGSTAAASVETIIPMMKYEVHLPLCVHTMNHKVESVNVLQKSEAIQSNLHAEPFTFLGSIHQSISSISISSTSKSTFQ